MYYSNRSDLQSKARLTALHSINLPVYTLIMLLLRYTRHGITLPIGSVVEYNRIKISLFFLQEMSTRGYCERTRRLAEQTASIVYHRRPLRETIDRVIVNDISRPVFAASLSRPSTRNTRVGGETRRQVRQIDLSATRNAQLSNVLKPRERPDYAFSIFA